MHWLMAPRPIHPYNTHTHTYPHWNTQICTPEPLCLRVLGIHIPPPSLNRQAHTKWALMARVCRFTSGLRWIIHAQHHHTNRESLNQSLMHILLLEIISSFSLSHTHTHTHILYNASLINLNSQTKLHHYTLIIGFRRLLCIQMRRLIGAR